MVWYPQLWWDARMGRKFLRTFLTERTGIRINPDVVQKRGSETRTTSCWIKWSKQCPSAEWQKQIVTIYSNLQYDLTLQGVHQNRLVLVWGCLRHTSRLIDFIHCHSLWRVQPGFVSLILQRPKDWFFSQRARSESSDPHKLQPQWFMGTFHVWVTCETCPT